jgi:hypothetical protein
MICSGELRGGRRSEEKDDKLMEEAGEKAGEGDVDAKSAPCAKHTASRTS